MKRSSFYWLAASCLCLGFAAADAGNQARAAEPPADASITNLLAPEGITTYANLNKTEFEYGAQARLVRELAQDHLQRADAAKKGNEPDKAKWETDLANELSDKAAAIQKQTDEATKQRTAFEEGHKSLSAALFGVGPKGLDADETALLTRLDERLFKANQELTAAIEVGNGYASTLQTNTTIAQISRVSELLDQNNKRVRQFEKERADLETQRLLYRALRRR